MGMKVEALDALKQVQRVQAAINLGGRRTPVRRRRGPQPEAIFDRRAEPGKQCTREASETLAGRNGAIAMVQVLRDLSPFAISRFCVCGLPDVVMRADEDQMIGIVEEPPDRLHLSLTRRLGGAEGVEADDDDGVDVSDQRCVERSFGAVVVYTFDLDDGPARQGFDLLDESGEIRLFWT
jgi:hypothetical protein